MKHREEKHFPKKGWKIRCSYRFFLEGVAVHVNILRNKKEEYFVSKNVVWCVIPGGVLPIMAYMGRLKYIKG